jgi:hypothetical protein
MIALRVCRASSYLREHSSRVSRPAVSGIHFFPDLPGGRNPAECVSRPALSLIEGKVEEMKI